ncbi:hypothetical protein [Amycolatopsis sp. lyj-23]|uniref:hypothetical protein n=1 Tax=Amycolatopsis sp. lyj-23 TaxID=2789283 RepID=UPI00397B9C2A
MTHLESILEGFTLDGWQAHEAKAERLVSELTSEKSEIIAAIHKRGGLTFSDLCRLTQVEPTRIYEIVIDYVREDVIQELRPYAGTLKQRRYFYCGMFGNSLIFTLGLDGHDE